MICGQSCNSYFDKDYHPEYFDSVYRRVTPGGDTPRPADLDYLDSAYNVFPRAGIGDLYKKYETKRNFYYGINSDFKRGMIYNDSIINLLEDHTAKTNFARLYAEALFIKGDIMMFTKKYDESLHTYVQGKQVVLNTVKDSCALSGYNGRIARLMYAQGKYMLAANYYMQGFQDRGVCEQNNFLRFASMQEYLDNIGMCYNLLGMYDSAEIYFNKALDFINDNEKKLTGRSDYVALAKAVVYGNQAEMLEKKGEHARAEELYLKSISGTENVDLPYTQTTQLKLVRFYFDNNQLHKIEKLLDQVKTSIDRAPNETSLINWYQFKKDYYIKTNQSAIANEYMKKYFSLTDSLEKRDRQFIAMDISSEFENREQKAINETLKKDSQLKTVYLIITVLVSFMSIIIMVLVWYNLRRSKRFLKEMEVLNSKINLKNEDLQKAFNSLEQSHKENSHIMRVVAHDLKNPISAISNMIFSLLKKDHAPQVKDMLELIKDACNNSLALIKEMLTEKKDKDEVKKEVLDMRRLLEQCVELLQVKADEKNQQLKLQAEQLFIMVDRQRFWRVVSNIVNNAIKFSPHNSFIRLKLEKKENSVLLSIQDYGIGIPMEMKENIFSMSSGSGRVGTAGEESYGMGLSITKKIVEEHNGKIWFESVLGLGTTFYIELPL